MCCELVCDLGSGGSHKGPQRGHPVQLAEIVRYDLGRYAVDRFEVDRFQHAAFFEDAADDDKAVLGDDLAKAFEDVGHHDEVRMSGLVLKRDKDNVLRRHRALAYDHGSGYRHDVSG